MDWILPARVATAVDLGAGTGALARLLVGRADEVVAVEPDDRMRAVLAEAVPGVRAVAGTGESMPAARRAAREAVVASSSWHWMDTVPALREVGRVLGPGRHAGGPLVGGGPESALIAQAQALLSGDGPVALDESSRDGALGGPQRALCRASQTLEIPPGVPFDQPEQHGDHLGRGSQRRRAGRPAGHLQLGDPDGGRQLAPGSSIRRGGLLRDAIGVEGDVTVDVGYRAEVWKARRHG